MGDSAKEGLTDQQSELLNLLADFEWHNNSTLSRTLGLTLTQYWPVRDPLLDLNLVARQRGGPGGSTRLIPDEAAAEPLASEVEESAAADSKPEVTAAQESDYYEQMRLVIEGGRASELRVNPLAVEEIAHQGRRSTGGKWTRPDIVSVELNSYQFVPGKYIDITTFEVKHRDGIDLTAVYEALGHRRSATRSYVLLYIPDGEYVKPETLAAIEEAAKSHGIGLIIAKKADDYSEWDERVEAIRWDPPPAKLDEFIRKQLSQGTKNLLEAAVK